VAGFDNAPEAFLECSTARLRLGGMPMPPMTVVVLRLDGRQFTLNTPAQALRANGRFDFFEWRLRTSAGGVRISAHLHAPAPAFVALRYDNPPGGSKVCLNTGLAACTVVLEQPGKPARTLVTTQRAAFEILTERSDHGSPSPPERHEPFVKKGQDIVPSVSNRRAQRRFVHLAGCATTAGEGRCRQGRESFSDAPGCRSFP
jgi:hypothetical protein